MEGIDLWADVNAMKDFLDRALTEEGILSWREETGGKWGLQGPEDILGPQAHSSNAHPRLRQNILLLHQGGAPAECFPES